MRYYVMEPPRYPILHRRRGRGGAGREREREAGCGRWVAGNRSIIAARDELLASSHGRMALRAWEGGDNSAYEEEWRLIVAENEANIERIKGLLRGRRAEGRALLGSVGVPENEIDKLEQHSSHEGPDLRLVD